MSSLRRFSFSDLPDLTDFLNQGGKTIAVGARRQEIFLDFVMTSAHLQSASYLLRFSSGLGFCLVSSRVLFISSRFDGMKSSEEQELQNALLHAVGSLSLGARKTEAYLKLKRALQQMGYGDDGD